jgi:hypothetical protein
LAGCARCRRPRTPRWDARRVGPGACKRVTNAAGWVASVDAWTFVTLSGRNAAGSSVRSDLVTFLPLPPSPLPPDPSPTGPTGAAGRASGPAGPDLRCKRERRLPNVPAASTVPSFDRGGAERQLAGTEAARRNRRRHPAYITEPRTGHPDGRRDENDRVEPAQRGVTDHESLGRGRHGRQLSRHREVLPAPG